METSPPVRLRSQRLILLLAPLVFALHVYEEYPAFIEWMNRRVSVPMTTESFAVVNGAAIVVTLIVAGVAAIRPGRAAAIVIIGWLSFLMLANGTLHLLATAIERVYCPGAITAAVLYLPYFAWAFAACRRMGGLSGRAGATAAAIGALPMLVQGVGVFLTGRRLMW
jgi:hypothetical protein